MNNLLRNLASYVFWLKYTNWFFLLAFTILLITYAFVPVADPDFWWHLKSGQTMLEEQGLMHTDPFTFSGDAITSSRESLILKGYWLWQIISAALFNLLNFKGIILLKLITIFIIGGATAREIYRQRINPAISALLLSSGLFLFISSYQLERPQIITFACTCLLANILCRFEQTQRFTWTLPILMLFWANMHGGFIVGDILLAGFALGAVIQYRQQADVIRHILKWISFSIAISLVNPTGGLAFYASAKFYNTQLMANVIEYQSTFDYFSTGGYFVAILWLLILTYTITTLVNKRIYWPELFIVIFLSWFSIMHMRNIGLFVPAMLPAIGRSLNPPNQDRNQFRIPQLAQIVVILVCSCSLIWLSYGLGKRRTLYGDVQQIYPEKSIDFIESNGLSGNMFNSYEYGGYLLWRLAPQTKIFIDGRGLDPQVFSDYATLISATTGQSNTQTDYLSLLDKYKIDYVFQQVYQGDGSVQPLMIALLNRPDWVPIYLDNFVYILSRVTPQTYEVITQNLIDKKEFKLRLMLYFNYISQQNPDQVGYRIAQAGMMIYMGMYEQARQQIEVIKKLSPNDASLPKLINDLNISRYQQK